MNNTSIIILTYNNLDYNIQCIESIRTFTEKNTYEIVVVDNGSTDGTREWLLKQNDLKLIFPNENTGFPKGCNLGIEAAEKENDILLLNNDTVVTPNWLYNLRTCLYNDELTGAVGPITNYAWNHQSIDVHYTSIQEMIKFSETLNNSDNNKWEPKIKLIGFCLLIKRKVLNTIGLLDEIFSPGNFEDDDLCVRITEAGYNLFLCNDCFIHHYGNITFNKEPEKFNNVLTKNSQKFKEKWGFDSFNTEKIDSEVLSLITEPKEKNMNILEVGCGRSTTLLRLKYLYPNSQLFGIETDKAVSNYISKLIKVSTKDLETCPLEFNKEFFDYIILNDYLTYCKTPFELLKELKKHLTDEGYLIASVPNLIHYSVINDLLKGDFIYGQNHLLNTHQKNFFTYNDIHKLAEACGYGKPYIVYCYNTVNEEDTGFLNSLCTLSGENMRWNYLSYKYVIKFPNTI